MAVTQYGFHDKLINRFSSTLDGAITDSDTSIAVDDATGLPTEGFFRLLVDSEIIICSHRSGDTLTAIERGSEGTVAASHLTAATVECVCTNGALQKYLLTNSRGDCAAHTEETSFDDSHAWPIPINRASDEDNAVLTASDFTWHNQGTATLTDSNGAFRMTCPSETGFHLRGVTIPVPSAPYAFTARFSYMVAPSEPVGPPSTHYGLWIRDSGGKITTMSVRAGQALAMWNFTDWQNFSAAPDFVLDYHDIKNIWLRIEDDGVDHKGYASLDGSNWSHDGSSWWQQSRTNFLTSGGNGIGFYMDSLGSGNSGSGPAIGTISIDSFHVEEM